jgi:hypothetical protein
VRLRERPLCIDSRRDGVTSALKDDKEAIACRIHLAAIVTRERLAQEPVMLAKHAAELRTQLPRELRRAFDISE